MWIPSDPQSNAASSPPAPACVPPCGKCPSLCLATPCPLVHLPFTWDHQVSPSQGTSQLPVSSSVLPAASWTASFPWTAQVWGHGRPRRPGWAKPHLRTECLQGSGGNPHFSNVGMPSGPTMSSEDHAKVHAYPSPLRAREHMQSHRNAVISVSA